MASRSPDAQARHAAVREYELAMLVGNGNIAEGLMQLRICRRGWAGTRERTLGRDHTVAEGVRDVVSHFIGYGMQGSVGKPGRADGSGTRGRSGRERQPRVVGTWRTRARAKKGEKTCREMQETMAERCARAAATRGDGGAAPWTYNN